MILKKGDKGEQVKELQTGLKILADGIFGQKTEDAVKKFQSNNKLKTDGVVGPKTWQSLLKNTISKIKSVFVNTLSNKEDFSDPEEEMPIDDNVLETLPTCKNTTELIALINNSNITRNVNRLVFHCTATKQSATVKAIVNYWENNLGWKNPGYHIIVKPDGSWTQLLDFNGVSNGVAGINSTSIHISYIGGIDDNGKAFDNRTKEQELIFETVYRTFKNKMPDITYHGHYEFSKKSCPSFNVKNWLETLEVEV